MCHGKNEKTHFCDNCHHGTDGRLRVQRRSSRGPTQHPKAVAKSGVKSCTEKLPHAEVLPRLPHRARSRSRRRTSSATGLQAEAADGHGLRQEAGRSRRRNHALEAQKSIESCAVCHGDGGIEREVLQELPQAGDAAPGRVQEVPRDRARRTSERARTATSARSCAATATTSARRSREPWIKVHGASVNKNGSADCCARSATPRSVLREVPHRAARSSRRRTSRAKFVRDYSADEGRARRSCTRRTARPARTVTR